MQATEPTPSLLSSIVNHWRAVVLAVLVTAVAAFGYSALQDTKYSATASFIFSVQDPILEAPLTDSSSDSPDPERIAATIVQLASGRDVIERTATAVGLTPDEVDDAISVKSEGISNLISVTASAGDPAFAASLADEYINQYITIQREASEAQIKDAKKELLRRLDDLSASEKAAGAEQLLRQRLSELVATPGEGGVQFASHARVPEDPSSPHTKLNVAIGALFGLLLGLALAATLERRDLGYL
jgi:uncharacterized protein involved in exopolysaccharide biosynthesis